MSTQTMEQKFGRIRGLEALVKMALAAQAFGFDADTRARAKANEGKLKAQMYAAVDALTAEEQVTYGIWRRQQR